MKIDSKTEAKLVLLADELVGTCDSLSRKSEVLELDENLLDDPAASRRFDELAMACDVCGWWVRPEDMSDGEVCNDCHEDEDHPFADLGDEDDDEEE